MLETALHFAARGRRIMPVCWADSTGGCGFHEDCEEPGKRPLTSWVRGGRGHRATTEATVIEVWWRRWPEAGMAMATGSGIAVLDVDLKPDVDGDVSLAHLQRTYGDLPRTVVTRTPSGGAHLWFTVDDDERVANSVSSLGPGLDVRGDGGFVVVPPSPGYRFDTEAGLRRFRPATAPAWLVDLVQPRGHDDSTPSGGNGTEALTALNAAKLAGFVRWAPSGERNSRLYWAACRVMEASGCSEDEMVKHAQSELVRNALLNGLSRAEIDRTIDSARHSGGVR